MKLRQYFLSALLCDTAFTSFANCVVCFACFLSEQILLTSVSYLRASPHFRLSHLSAVNSLCISLHFSCISIYILIFRNAFVYFFACSFCYPFLFHFFTPCIFLSVDFLMSPTLQCLRKATLALMAIQFLLATVNNINCFRLQKNDCVMANVGVDWAKRAHCVFSWLKLSLKLFGMEM